MKKTPADQTRDAPQAKPRPAPSGEAGRARLGGHGVEALLFTCMDYRLLEPIALYMRRRGLARRYDHVILAGASLGVLNDTFAGWAETFWQHLDLSIRLHEIRRLMVMDHRDCGAYKTLLGRDFALDPEAETQIHRRHLIGLRARATEKYPDLAVDLLLMGLDGKVETIA